MAQRTIVMLEDDIDGSEATQTIKFQYDGTAYEIDLNDKNAKKFRAALGPFAAKSRKVGRGPSSPRRMSTRAGADKEQLTAIRAWARANGYTVSDRGRIGQAVMEAYHSAGKGS